LADSRENISGVVRAEGFTLIELLVVMSIISLLMGIVVPMAANVRRKAKVLQGMSNQRRIVQAVSFFADDNDERYPESVATIGEEPHWNWQEPTMITGWQKHAQRYRSMSAYLCAYIEKANILHCSNAPRKNRYLQTAWDAGEDWDNPDTQRQDRDPVYGTYCFWWNYVGCLGNGGKRFFGPRGPAGGKMQSKLLVSCYLGFNHWRNPESYVSCEKFAGAQVTEKAWVCSDYWWKLKAADGESAVMPKIKLHGGYVDGHVGSYSSSDVVGMKVSVTSDGSKAYPDGVLGEFYLPTDGVR